MIETIQELPSQIDWYKEGGLAAVVFILLLVAGWLLRLYISERKAHNATNKDFAQQFVDLNKDYACAYRELLERVLITSSQGNEALDKLHTAINIKATMEQTKRDIISSLKNGGRSDV